MILVGADQEKNIRNAIILLKMIKFVYFDLGGVIIKDFTATNKWADLKKELGIAQDDKKFDEFWDKYEHELCVGRNTESLIPLLKKEFNIKHSQSYSLLKDGFIKRFEKNKLIWPLISDSVKSFKIGILTNMYPHMLSEIKKAKLLPNILWDVIIDSSIVKLEKPNQSIYRLAEKEADAKGNEILFIDNTFKNLEAAQNLNWQIFFYDSYNIPESNQRLKHLLNSLTPKK